MALDLPSDLSLADQIAAVQGWWRDAGVDCAFADEPVRWLKEPEPEQAEPQRQRAAPVAAPAPAALTAPSITAADLPGDLAAFRQWWCDPASPLPCPPAPRLAPLGEPGARLMLLAPMPEDGDTGQVLSGPQGRLLRAILAALEVAEDEAYFATALPAAMAMPDWDGLRAEGLDVVTRHHIALARPQRLLVLGRPLAPLVEHAELPCLATYAPDQLLANARLRAGLWQRLLDWMPPA